jgi:hypothetical protein
MKGGSKPRTMKPRVVSRGKKPPESGITKGKEPSQTQFQKELSTWDKKYPR